MNVGITNNLMTTLFQIGYFRSYYYCCCYYLFYFLIWILALVKILKNALQESMVCWSCKNWTEDQNCNILFEIHQLCKRILLLYRQIYFGISSFELFLTARSFVELLLVFLFWKNLILIFHISITLNYFSHSFQMENYLLIIFIFTWNSLIELLQTIVHV